MSYFLFKNEKIVIVFKVITDSNHDPANSRDASFGPPLCRAVKCCLVRYQIFNCIG